MNETNTTMCGWTSRLLGGLLLIGTAGCLAAPADDGRLEHHVPPHKPAHFVAAVAELDLRLQRLAAGQESDPATAWSELLDVVSWLPGLAADTDLRKADWDQVAQISQSLQLQLQEVKSRPTEGQAALLDVARGIAGHLQPIAEKVVEESPHLRRAETSGADADPPSSAP